LKIKNVAIVTNLEKPKSKVVTLKLIDWLKKKKIKTMVNDPKPASLRASDLVIGVGGDGMMLHVARKAAPLGKPVLGINAGSLGFLAEIDPDHMFKAIEEILANRYKIQNRFLLEAIITRKNKIAGTFTALNDVVIKNGATARVIKLALEVNKQYVATYTGDGLILSTPTGSTAYALAASGPIVYPDVPVITIVAICPHTLTLRPLIISSDSEINVKVQSNHHEVILTLDGQHDMPLGMDDTITIKKAKHQLKFITIPDKSYYQVLRTKLKWGER
jgi:NAD+ kinase